MMKKIRLKDFSIGGDEPFVLIAGPCVIENEESTLSAAEFLKDLTGTLGIPFIFKSSFDKANRTSKDSYRGPGLEEGLRILNRVKREMSVPVLSDVHRFEEIEAACDVLDVVQVPAFLCRQTDFVMEVARRAAIVNIKKGQFLAPWDISQVIEKVFAAGNKRVMVTERGVSFGYNTLVADMRSIPLMRGFGSPVVFDATHSVQSPGGAGTCSGGDREMAFHLARAAAAVGVDGIFMEVHERPDKALCDGPNSIAMAELPDILKILKEIDETVKRIHYEREKE
ncbi:MAG: 3-deoxy-8-phosphooctulonate synthase [Deltaproteobacteria bacterium]|nr:3-deoxy-8-phosphooctulonate synthase [Deltaproteobacteria bacterium]